MNRDYAETYAEHKSGKYEYIKGFGRLGCYRGLDYIENLLKNDKYYSEELEDNFIFIQSYINFIEQQCKKQREVIDNIKKCFDDGHFEDYCDCLIIEKYINNYLNEVSE